MEPAGFFESSAEPLALLFICRGSVHDGIGHITRSMAVASHAKQSAKVQVIVIGDPALVTLFAQTGLAVQFVSSDQETLPFFTAHQPQIVFLDLLQIEADVFQQLKTAPLLVNLSPVFNFITAVDLFFHRSRVLPEALVQGLHQVEIYSGLEYTVVSDRCSRIPTEIFKRLLFQEPLSIAIAMGGTDAANKTLQILRTVKSIEKPMIFWVLLGEGYGYSYQTLVDEMQGSRHEIILAKTNDSMWHVLSMCSVGIFAGGVTTYEAAYAGLPSINLLENLENHFLITELSERGMGIIAEKAFPQSLESLNSILIDFSLYPQKLLDMHKHSQHCLDHLGVDRILQKSVSCYHKRQNATLMAKS